MCNKTPKLSRHKTPSSEEIRSQFMLDPEVVHLNNGSAGACPKAVFTKWQELVKELETQPDRFIWENPEPINTSRATLERFLNADNGCLAFVPNVTTGLNTIIRSLPISKGDEVLTTSYTYAAIDKTYRFYSIEKGFSFRSIKPELPVSTHENFVDWFMGEVRPETKVIHLDHIASASALILPVEEICKQARKRGILTVIDGGHAPGQLDLDLQSINADFYSGNLHKWMFSPKGVGFLHVRPELKELIKPIIVSHGWEENPSESSNLQDLIEWSGTSEYMKYLLTPEIIKFMTDNNWSAVRERCYKKIPKASDEILNRTNWTPMHQGAPEWNAQMVAFRIPESFSPDLVKMFITEYGIRAWTGLLDGNQVYRLSIQGYNTDSDLEALYSALSELHS